jgi:spore maturation protein SpmA
MSKIWIVLLILSAIAITVSSPIKLLESMTSATESSFLLCFDLLIVYSVWLGILQIAEDSGLSNKLSNKLSPFTSRLFGKIDPETNKVICLNIATNILGMGGVSTPMGIEAMKRLQDGSEKATNSMKLLFVLSATSLQILPTTVIGLRIAYGSLNASDIFLPTLLATTLTTLIGTGIALILNKRKKCK